MKAVEYIAKKVSHYNRERKWKLFLDTFNMGENTKILDIGFSDNEYKDSDNWIEKHYPHLENLTALGVDEPVLFRTRYPKVKVVRYAGREFPFFDKEFDICWTNAVIEHVGTRADQLLYLKEIKRTGKAAFITTPNKLFPIEVHTRVPFLHWLPKNLFDRFLKMIGKDWAAGDYMNLLTLKDLKALLQEAEIEDYKIYKNKILGLTMDFVIIIN